MKPIISPSLLAADLMHLEDEVRRVENAGLSWLHFDHMDGHFVPNISFGPDFVAAVRKKTKLFLDVHLMLTDPIQYVERYAAAGADSIAIHVEANDVRETLEKIRSFGLRPALAINPGTPASAVEPYLDIIGMVIVMTVQPGFGGQSMRTDCLAKAGELKKMAAARGDRILVEVDGGVNMKNAQMVVSSGVDVLVMGTGFFRAEDPKQVIQSIEALKA